MSALFQKPPKAKKIIEPKRTDDEEADLTRKTRAAAAGVAQTFTSRRSGGAVQSASNKRTSLG